MIRWPQGSYNRKEDYLDDFKRINRVTSMNERAFLKAIKIENNVVSLNTRIHLGTIVTQSRSRELLIKFMTWFVNVTDRK